MKTQKGWPRVSKSERFHQGAAEVRYMIDHGVVNGKRVREFRTTLEAANARAKEIRDESDQLGVAASMLSNEIKKDAIDACTLLNGACTLTTAAKYYVENNAGLESPTVSTVIQRVIEAKMLKDLRPRSMQGLRWHLGKLEAEFGPRLIKEIKVDDLQNYFTKVSGGSKSAHLGHIRYASIVFGYAVKKDWLNNNPCEKVDRPNNKLGAPEFMLVDDVEKLFAAVESSTHAKAMIPRMALGFFSGIRVEELDRLDWKDINFEEKYITIRREVAKCRVPRHVTILPNLLLWLMKYRSPEGLVGLQHQRFAIYRREIMEKKKIAWPQNAMRHTFASNHVAMWEDAPKTAFELGHLTGTQLLYKSYRGLTSKKDAERYWGIKPGAVMAATERKVV